MGVTPVPIPNTMVKTQAADGTALETVWESRWLPEFEKRKLVLPVIRGLKGFSFLMTDETSSQSVYMRLKPFFGRVQARYETEYFTALNASIQHRKYSFRNVP